VAFVCETVGEMTVSVPRALHRIFCLKSWGRTISNACMRGVNASHICAAISQHPAAVEQSCCSSAETVRKFIQGLKIGPYYSPCPIIGLWGWPNLITVESLIWNIVGTGPKGIPYGGYSTVNKWIKKYFLLIDFR
jgi:hypothetical protein